MNSFCWKILLQFALGCVICEVVQAQEEAKNPSQNVTTPDYQLELIQAVWRHGNRTAVFNYPTPLKEYLNNTVPYEFGRLTPHGRRASLKMGQFFRKRYADFLPSYFSYPSAHITCTADTRSQESSWVAMNGVWPPIGPQVWQDQGLGQLWTPIPCDYVPILQDKVWAPEAFCPRMIELVSAAQKTPTFQAEMQKLTKFGLVNQYIAFNEGLPSVSDIELTVIYDSLLSEESNGNALPHWTNLVYPSPLREIYGVYLNLFNVNTEITKLSVGEFWKMTMEMATKVEKGDFTPKDRVFLGYSAHDLNVACLLKSLELVPKDELPVPTFTAAFMIEWYRDKSNSSLIGAKFVYRNSTIGDAVTLTIPGCDEICPLEVIRGKLADLIPIKSRAEYCQPLQPVLLADFERFLKLTKLWLPPEFIPEYKSLVARYLKGEDIHLR